MKKHSHLSLLFNIAHFCRKMLKGDAHIDVALLSTAVLHASHRWCPALSGERKCWEELNTWVDVPRSLVQQKHPRFVLGNYLVRNMAWIRAEFLFVAFVSSFRQIPLSHFQLIVHQWSYHSMLAGNTDRVIKWTTNDFFLICFFVYLLFFLYRFVTFFVSFLTFLPSLFPSLLSQFLFFYFSSFYLFGLFFSIFFTFVLFSLFCLLLSFYGTVNLLSLLPKLLIISAV